MFRIRASSNWKLTFDFCIILLTLIYCMRLLYIIVFVPNHDMSNNIFDYIVMISYIIYIILNFFQCFIDKKTGEEISDLKLIAKHYIKGWFIIDIVSSLPWELFSTPYVRLIRILRLNKIFTFFFFIERVSFKIRHLIAIFQLCFFGIFGTFIFSCLWYFLCKKLKKDSEKNFIDSNIKINLDNKENYFSYLLICFYYILTTLTTTGFGDIVPYTTNERFIATLMMLLGVLYFSFLMSVLYKEIKIIGEDNQTLEAQKLILDLKKFNVDKLNEGISKKVNKKILNDIVFANKHSRYEKVSKKENFDILPKKIKYKLSEFLWKDIYNQFYIYFELNIKSNFTKLLFKFAENFQFKLYQPKEILYSINNTVEEINIIQSGYIDIINYKTLLKKRQKPGDFIGHFYILFDVKPSYEYKAASTVEVVSLEKNLFLKYLKENDNLEHFKNISLMRFREIFHQINNSKGNNNNNKENIIIDADFSIDKKDVLENSNNSIENRNTIVENKTIVERESKIEMIKESGKIWENEYKNIIKNLNKLITNENYLAKNFYMNNAMMSEYKESFELERKIINKLNQKNK